jgi:methionyl-tRNA formyltransferase
VTAARAGADRPARTVFFGSGPFGLPILDALAAAPEVDLVAVVAAPDRTAGRRRELTSVPVAARAAELGIPLLQPASIRTPAAAAELAALRPALGVLADYGRLVPPAVLRLPRHGILNVHPSLLPRHRGASPIAGTILAGDARGGVTIIAMDSGLDTGPVVAAEAWPLEGTETAPELEAQAAHAGAALVRRTLGPWLAGQIEAAAQDESAATMTRPLRREDGRLDPERPVVARLAIWRAEAIPGWVGSEDASPGRFGRFGLYARDGYLALREVQPAGGRRMTFDELVRGRPGIIGSSVEGEGG